MKSLSPLYNPRAEHLLFVYGTLKNGFKNNFYLHNAKYIGDAITTKDFAIVYDGKLPYLLHMNKELALRVKGELFKLNGEQLRLLDIIEGHPSWYTRELITVYIDKSKVTAYTYFLNEKELRKLSIFNNIQHPSFEFMDEFDVPEWKEVYE